MLKVGLTLGLVDKPGQLAKALEPIARCGGNIVSIIHERERITGGYVPVSLVIDFPSLENLRRVKEELEELDIPIIGSEEVGDKSYITVLLIGRIEYRELIDDVEMFGGRVIALEASRPSVKGSSIKLDIETPADTVGRVLEGLRGLAEENGMVMIPSW
jgi:ACT domain-containing protein